MANPAQLPSVPWDAILRMKVRKCHEMLSSGDEDLHFILDMLDDMRMEKPITTKQRGKINGIYGRL